MHVCLCVKHFFNNYDGVDDNVFDVDEDDDDNDNDK